MISFIIPVYNMEKYVNRCIDSIINQQVKEWEIIAVDDGSADQSPGILDNYAKEDSRIRVVHKENQGIASAVADGLALAAGEYIAFVDSDDYIDNNMLGILQPFEGKYDIIQFNMVQEDENGAVLGYIKFPIEEVTGAEKILSQYFAEYRMPSMACRIFKRELFEGIEICGRNIGIDEMVTLQLMSRANTLLSIDNILYHIYVRTSSVSRSVYSKSRIQEVITVHDFLWDCVQNYSEVLKQYVLIKNIQAYLGMFAFCEEEIFQEEKQRIQEGIQRFTEYASQCGVWKPVKSKLGTGFKIYQFSSNLYRFIQQARRG